MRSIFASILGALLHAALAGAAPTASVVFVNGAVYSGDAARRWASAVVVRGERIAYVGDDRGAQAFVTGQTRVIDLHGRMVLPAFQDSHAHPQDAPNPATTLDLHGLVDRGQSEARIRDYAQAHPEATWILGDGWDESAFLPSGQPTRQLLDALVPDRPALLYDNAGHEAWANTRALEVAHVTAATPDPVNGRIEREDSGAPAGSLQEQAAMDLVAVHVPPMRAETMLANLTAALDQMTALGFAAVVDAMATPESARAYQTLDRRGQLTQRTHLCMEHKPERDDAAQLQFFKAQRAALQGRRLRADCVKLFLDGAYGSHTVVLLAPYVDDPKYGTGQLFIEPARLNRLVTALDAEGFQVHMHAQGDGAVRAGLDAIEAAHHANGPRDNRHTIAHLCLIDAADIARFRRLGVVANMSPLWSLGDPWETVFAPRLFGPERSQHIFQTRTLLAAGVTLAWGSDWPVTGVSPLDGLETATTRRYPGGRDMSGHEDQSFLPEERLNLEQAISGYTNAGAYLSHEEGLRGALVPGLAADLVVLDRNLFDSPPLAIHEAKVDLTMVAGQVVYTRPGEGSDTSAQRVGH